MKSQLITLLGVLLFVISTQAQHHSPTTNFTDGCYYINNEIVGCIKYELQPCDNFWYFQLSAPVADGVPFIIGNGYVYFDMDFLQCYSSADGDKCFCLSFAVNTFDGSSVHTIPGITQNCNNFRIHAFEPMELTGSSCGDPNYFHFPCPQLFWALPYMEDDAPTNQQIIRENSENKGVTQPLPTVVLPATDGNDYNYYTSYIDVSPALIDDLLLFFSQHPEYPLGDYLHVQYECVYLSAPQEFADNNPYGFDAVERIEFYCPTIVMDTCTGDAALESTFGVLLQVFLTVDGDNYVSTSISNVSIAARTHIVDIGENYIGAAVTLLFMDALYEIDVHLAYTFPHCGSTTADCPNPWGSGSEISSQFSDFFSWIVNSPPPSSKHHHHHHKSPSPISFSPITISSLSSSLFSSNGSNSGGTYAWIATLAILPAIFVCLVIFILVFALVVKKAGAFQRKRELNDGENVYSMMINE